VTLYSLVESYERFGGTCCSHLQDLRIYPKYEYNRFLEIVDKYKNYTVSHPRITAINLFCYTEDRGGWFLRTAATFYRTTQSHIPGDSNVHIHHRDSFRSHPVITLDIKDQQHRNFIITLWSMKRKRENMGRGVVRDNTFSGGPHISCFEGSRAVLSFPSGRGIFEGGKASGSEKGKVLGCWLCYEQRREVKLGPNMNFFWIKCNILSRVRISVTNNKGFWTWWLDLLNTHKS
jgi:hypothetical protein